MAKIWYDPQLFAEGAGATGGTQGASAAGTQNQREENEGAGASANANAAGASTAATESGNQGTAAAAAEPTFEDLISGKYKSDFDARVQDIVKGRLKSAKGAEESMGKLTPALELLAKKHGVEANDLDGLVKAITDDDSLYEDEAMRLGISTEAMKRLSRVEAQNEAYQRQQAQQYQQAQESGQRQEQEKRVQEHFAGLMQQADALRARYPGFDLNAELKNPEFFKLTAPGSPVTLEQAYYLVHQQEIGQAQIAQGAKAGQAAVAAAVAANGRRPTESGARTGAAAVKLDPGKMTKQQRADIWRRAAMGEIISFD